MYQEIIFRPLYNGLVGLMDVLPWIDVGIAVIVFTIIVKLILFPLSKSSILTQVRMKEVEPEMNRIKQQYANDRQVQAVKVMELYKKEKIKPFAGILLLFIQLPILLALISVFYKIVPHVDASLLYSFILAPDIKTHFLGLFDLSQKSLVLSLTTAVVQFLQIHYSPAMRDQKRSAKQVPAGDFASEMASSMSKQMKFLLPLIAFASTYWLIPMRLPQAASIIAIYWTTSTLFTLAQELFIRHRYANGKSALPVKLD